MYDVRKASAQGVTKQLDPWCPIRPLDVEVTPTESWSCCWTDDRRGNGSSTTPYQRDRCQQHPLFVTAERVVCSLAVLVSQPVLVSPCKTWACSSRHGQPQREDVSRRRRGLGIVGSASSRVSRRDSMTAGINIEKPSCAGPSRGGTLCTWSTICGESGEVNATSAKGPRRTSRHQQRCKLQWDAVATRAWWPGDGSWGFARPRSS